MNMRLPRAIMLVCMLAGGGVLCAQDSRIRFGKISPADFNLKPPSFDSTADAVVIADIGSSSFVGNSKGWFTLDFIHHRRMKIFNKKGFDAATEQIYLYTDGEKLDGLKAVTYNLENGKVVETRLDEKSIFTDKISKELSVKKFTFPALKEGSVIEYSYVLHSDYLTHLQPWTFQGGYPCLYSEYEVDIPNFFQYVTLSQGFLDFQSKVKASRNTTFRLSIPGGASRDENVSFDDEVVDKVWTMKNIPSLREERYTTTIDNYVSKIEFQLARYAFPQTTIQDKMGNWLSVSAALMKSDYFGADLKAGNGWLDEETKAAVGGATTKLDKARNIYTYVRDHYTCTDHSSLWANSPIKTAFKNHNGNVAEINLLLVAMLNHAKVTADPVILSTRGHGFTNEMYPLLSRFNYVVVRLAIDSTEWYLDASEPWIGFGHLPERCYNGHARVISKDDMPMPVYFNADEMLEKKVTTVFISDGGKGVLTGNVQSVPGYFESCGIRERVKDKGDAAFFKTVQASYPGETEVLHTSIDSLKLMDEPVGLNYEIRYKIDPSEDIVYFTPMLAEAYKENPFAAAERHYPVEMPCGIDETYILNMEVPEGYEVDELPKSTKVKFNDDEGAFEYLIVKNDIGIQFRSRVQLKKANFKPEDYASLRDFFGYIVKKQSEQIVFKKKK